MAPLNFSDSLNLWSLIGTWLGTLFTCFGFLAVFTKFRSLLKGLSTDRKELIKAAAGDWAICLPALRHSDTGVVEARGPSLLAWINYHYKKKERILVSPYARQSTGGQASWSQLFSRLQILPEDLIKTNDLSKANDMWSDIDRHTDLLIEGAKISFGLSGPGFSALLILSGLSPSAFLPNEVSKSDSHIGHMFLGPRDPFSQIAQADNSSIPLSKMQDSEGEGRFAHWIDVQHCIDLALGILRFDIRGRSKAIVPSRSFPASHAKETERDQVVATFQRPSAQRLIRIRRNLRLLTLGNADFEPLFEIHTLADFNFTTLRQNEFWSYNFPELHLEADDIELSSKIAFALFALHPAAFFPVIPQSIADSLCIVLRQTFPFLNSKSERSTKLAQEFNDCPKHAPFDIPGWTKASMTDALWSLNDIYIQNFYGLSSRCFLYYDAMKFVFRQRGIDFRSVEISLAAKCASHFVAPRFVLPSDSKRDEEYMGRWHSKFQAAMRERLNGSPIAGAELWAEDILATYIHAWLKESHHMGDDFLKNFRRRIFLG